MGRGPWPAFKAGTSRPASPGPPHVIKDTLRRGTSRTLLWLDAAGDLSCLCRRLRQAKRPPGPRPGTRQRSTGHYGTRQPACPVAMTTPRSRARSRPPRPRPSHPPSRGGLHRQLPPSQTAPMTPPTRVAPGPLAEPAHRARRLRRSRRRLAGRAPHADASARHRGPRDSGRGGGECVGARETRMGGWAVRRSGAETLIDSCGGWAV